MRSKAWKLTREAHEALLKYAVWAENHEEPRMSDDAIDALDLSDEIQEFDHRWETGIET